MRPSDPAIPRMTTPLAALGVPAGGRATVVRTPESVAAVHGRRAICSLALGTHEEFLAHSAHTFADYARRWGWDLVLSTENLASDRPASWAKVLLIRQLLQAHDWVLWLDADTIIVDASLDIGSLSIPGKDLYVAEASMSKGRQPANAGVLLIRSTDWSRRFFERVWQAEEHIHGKTWEQGAILQLLGYHKMVRPSVSNPDLDHVEIIDKAWNSTPADPSMTPRIMHFAGVSNRTKRLTLLFEQVEMLRLRSRSSAIDDTTRAEVVRSSLSSRDELPSLLDERGLQGWGAEIGVFRGQFSEHLLANWHGELLISIDPWIEQDPGAYVDKTNASQPEQEARYWEACERLARFGSRSQIWRMTSAEAASRVDNELLDFVYIDARHDEASVTEDLETWWDKVRPGGIISGHDYIDGVRKATLFGVKSAVDAFFAAHNLPVQVIPPLHKHPSWLVIKPS